MGEAKRKRDGKAKEQEETGGYEGIVPALDPDVVGDPDAAPGHPGVPEEDHPEKLQQPQPNVPLELRTAFLVLVSAQDGSVEVCSDITVDCTLERSPMMDDIYGAMGALMSLGALMSEDITEENFDTGFLVIVTREGIRWATNDINQPYVLDRHATVYDVAMAAPIVMKDILTMETANATLQMQMRTAAQMAEQQRVAKVSRALQQKGIHVPSGTLLRP